jgi:hypothetical protein
MAGRFYRFVRQRESPGLVLIEQRTPIGVAIDELRRVWACMDAEEFKNRILYLP